MYNGKRARTILSIMIPICAILTGFAVMRGEGASYSIYEPDALVMRNELIHSQNLVQSLDLTPIGESESTDIRMGYLQEDSQSQVIHYPGAAFIKVHFFSLHLLEGDSVTVSDLEGIEVYTYPNSSDYTSDEYGGFWAMSVMGDTVIIELHSQYNLAELDITKEELQQFGLVIDQYTRGYSLDRLDGSNDDLLEIETIRGKNDLKDVVCYQSSHPTEYKQSQAVARLILNNGKFLCTGWRVGPREDSMLTNNHCISTQYEVGAAEIWFNYQVKECGKSDIAQVTKVRGKDLLIGDATLDFALFTIRDPEKISSFGYIEPDPRELVLDEEIYIPQHPRGHPKKFGIESDLDIGRVCRIGDVMMDGDGVGTDTGYYCDTENSSSGSPVIARSTHKAIALHHSNLDPRFNKGVRIELIWPKIGPYLTTAPILINAKPKLIEEVWPGASGKKLGPGVELTWLPSSLDEVKQYQIQVSKDGGITWQDCKDCIVKMDGIIWHHGNQPCGFGYYYCLPQNQKYSYRIRALDSAGNAVTDWSNVVSAMSYGWPAHVELATPSPKGPYNSPSTVTLNLINTYGHKLQLKWQITPWSGATYKIISGCNDGDTFCRIEISSQTNQDTSYHLSLSKLALLKPMTSVDVTVIGENVIDGKSFMSSAKVSLLFHKPVADPTNT